MKRIGSITALMAAILIIGLYAQPADAKEKLVCSNLPYADDLSNIQLGVVTAAKAHFISDQLEKPNCPSMERSCQRSGFLVKGDKVAFDVDAESQPYLCVAYINARGEESDGWVPSASVKPVKSQRNWIGAWKRNTTAEITIKRRPDGRIALDGSATYGSGAATHDGGIEAVLDADKAIQGFATSFSTPENSQIPYEKAGQYECAVMLSQLGPYLFARDNQNCGGANVTFTGLYRRR